MIMNLIFSAFFSLIDFLISIFLNLFKPRLSKVCGANYSRFEPSNPQSPELPINQGQTPIKIRSDIDPKR